MKVAVIGTGHIGGTLGSKWRAAGHEVTYGSRRGGDGQEGPGGAPLRAIGEAMDGADVVVIAVPGGAVGEVLAEASGRPCAGRVVVDATNQMGGAERAAPAPAEYRPIGAKRIFRAGSGAIRHFGGVRDLSGSQTPRVDRVVYPEKAIT